MDLQQMNRIAITVLLGGFAALMVFMMLVLGFMQTGSSSYKRHFYPLLVVTGILVLTFLFYAAGTLKGKKKAAVTGWGTADRVHFNYIHKETPRKTQEKFLVILLCGLIVGTIISPDESLIRSILFFGFMGVLLWMFFLWALQYDPPPKTAEEEKDYLTPAELADPLTREIIVSQSYRIAFCRCTDVIRSIWGSMSLFADQDEEKGTIDFMYGNSHLAFVVTRLGDRRTRIFLSITPDLPQKWSPDKDRRQNILYLDRIRAELTRM